MIILTEKMSKFTAIDLFRMYQKIMLESVNHHEFSYLLDELHLKGILKVTGHNRDGMTEYSIDR